MIPLRRVFPSRTKVASAALAAAAVLVASAASLSCENALYDKVKRTQEIAASSKIVLAHEGAGIPNGAVLDLGKIVVGSEAVSVEIVILNDGADALEIDADRISIADAEGTETGTFAISSKPTPILAKGASASLVLECEALGLGAKRSTVTIPTNDVRYGNFAFVIALTGGNAGKVATPTFTPAGGSVGTDVAVTIDCDTAGASIYFTMTSWNSSSVSSTPHDPTTASTPYDPQVPIAIKGNGTNAMIKAIAVRNGYDDSSIAQTSFMVIYGSTAAQPVFDPLPDTYGSDRFVTIASAAAGASIHYETSSTGMPAKPTESSAVYSGPIQVAGDGTTLRIKAITVAPGVLPSAEAGGTYTIAYPRLAFDANGGTGPMEAQAIAAGASAAIRANAFARPGYTFAGWDTEAAGGGTRYADGADYAMGDTGATLHAQWVGKTYTVVFNAQDGTVLQTTLSAINGSTYGAAGALPTVARTGYSFDGWFTAPGGAGAKVTASTTVAILTDSTTEQILYALWTANSYQVEFDAQGGTCSTSTKSVTYGSTYGELPVPTKTGYSFGGWWTSGGESGAQVGSATAVAITAAQTLYAKWTANGYTVSLDAQGGTPSSATLTVTYGAAYGAMPTPARPYYNFGGWWTVAGGGGTEVTSTTTVAVTDDKTVLYAKWTGYSYTVSFDAQGGSVSPSSKSVTYASTYGELPAPTRTGYAFGGWWTATGGGGAQITSITTVTITEPQSLHAKWTANSYTASFDAQGGSVAPSSKSVTYDSTYGALPTPTCDDNVFGGWFTGVDGSGTQVAASTVISTAADHSLYARWIAASSGLSYALINGNTAYSVSAGAATSGSVILAPYHAGLPVTAIADNAFKNCTGLTGISIPQGIKSVGNSAFYNCSGITAMTLPAGLTAIWALAFNYCSGLTSLVIPDGTYLDGSVFMYCTNLASVTLPNDLTFVPGWVFYKCGKLANITIPASVTHIDEYAFNYCASLTSLTIPSAVTAVGASVCAFCTLLSSVTVQAATPPAGGNSMFSGTALAHLYVPPASVNAYKTASYWSAYASLISGY